MNIVSKKKDAKKMLQNRKIFSWGTFVVLTICTLIMINAEVYASTKYESENNDSYSNANTIVAGDSVIGTINSSSDNDYYQIVA